MAKNKIKNKTPQIPKLSGKIKLASFMDFS